jgi:uncharacterized damage-inducible protein DinB
MSVLEVVRRMHVYNQWADEQLFDAMDGMPPEALLTPAPVAFENLRGALWHSLGAQLGWLRVCAGFDTWSQLNVTDGDSVDGLRGLFDASHAMWREFIESLTKEDVLAPAEPPSHRWPRRPVWQSMLHVVNHSTQHRAEVGMHLLSLGRTPGDLDYGTFEEDRAIGLKVAGWE